MILIEQIISCVIINFQIADVDIVLMCGSFLDLSKNVAEWSWYDTSISIPLSTSGHGESLSRTSL